MALVMIFSYGKALLLVALVVKRSTHWNLQYLRALQMPLRFPIRHWTMISSYILKKKSLLQAKRLHLRLGPDILRFL